MHVSFEKACIGDDWNEVEYRLLRTVLTPTILTTLPIFSKIIVTGQIFGDEEYRESSTA
jgi:hypothetical protein